MRLILALPYPVSTNNLFVNAKFGRVIAPKYRAWIAHAGQMLQAQRPGKIAGRVSVLIELCAPTQHRADADNKIKCVLDVLVKHRIIAGDDQHTVREVTARWVDAGEPCTVTINGVD